MATLADINATLQMQTDAIGRQADAVTKSNEILDAVRQRISDMLTVQQNDQKERRRSDERARKTSIENNRETTKTPLPKGFISGFAQGTGFSWLSDFMSNTLGNLLSLIHI
jgi:F0F1-type ATP synthase assembly protein I